MPTRVFRFLLRAYPKDFRLDYGKQIEQVFRQDYEHEARHRGAVGIFRLWWELVIDTLRTAPREHFHDVAPDMRYASRILSRQAGFSFLVIGILALGIGATTAVFTVVNTIAFKPLPFREPDRLVSLWEMPPTATKTGQRSAVSSSLLVEWTSQAKSLSEVAALSARNLLLRDTSGDSQGVSSQGVTENLFAMLGTSPIRGRLFGPSDYAASSPDVAVISESLWRRRFGGEQTILGRAIVLNDRSYVVIGVLPAEFDFPAFFSPLLNHVDVWLPMRIADSIDPGNRWLRPIARLKDGVPVGQARAEIRAIAGRFAAEHAKTNTGFTADVQPLDEQLLGNIRPFSILLFGASLLVLMIALVNVVNLLLVNSVRRERELAVRTALGAGRARLTRQLIVEGLWLSVLGAGLGLCIAYVLLTGIVTALPAAYPVPRLGAITIDSAVVTFTMLIALVAGVTFGIFPNLIVNRTVTFEALKEGNRGSGGTKTRRAREVLVVCQLALSLVLLGGAGVLFKSLFLLNQINPGFRPSDVLTLSVRYSPQKYADPAVRAALLQDVLRRVESVPGVRSAAMTHSLPLRWPPAGASVIPAERPFSDPRDLEAIGYRMVSPNFLQTMGIRLVEGRDFTERDSGNVPTVAIVNQSLARRLWPGVSPIGKRLKRERPPSGELAYTAEVIGVFADVKQGSLGAAAMPEMFICYLQSPPRADVALAILLEPGMQSLAPSIREAILARDPELAVVDTKPMSQIVSDSLWRQRFSLVLMGGFGCIALILAAAGIFGVMSHVVVQRRQEFGIRLSLGAAPSSVLGMVLGRGLILTVLGLSIGGVVIGGVGRSVAGFLNAQGLLFGTSVHDLSTLVGVGLVLTLVSLAASSWPAWKATKVDPITILRSQ